MLNLYSASLPNPEVFYGTGNLLQNQEITSKKKKIKELKKPEAYFVYFHT